MVPPDGAIKIEESSLPQSVDSSPIGLKDAFKGSPLLVVGTNKRKQPSPLMYQVKESSKK